jgi:AAHS family 4-hydroxybenzoate transporter-like MFS transporter
MNAPAIDVARLIDEGRLGGHQKRLVALTALTIIFDGVDNQLLGISIPAIMAEWSASRSAFAPVVSLGLLGMMIGAATAGAAGDRVGRRAALLASVALFGASTLAIAAVQSIEQLAALRLIAGVGLGGALPNAAALAAEYVPQRHRPFAVTLTIVCVPLGGTLAGLFAIPAAPALGWRGLFASGGAVPLVAALVLARLLPESPRFLARRTTRREELVKVMRRMGFAIPHGATVVAGEGPTPARTPFATLVGADYRNDTLALWGAFFSCLLAVYLGFSWLPTILTEGGLGPAVANAGITVFNLGGVAGAIAGALCIARFGSRMPLLAMASGAAAGAAVLSAIPITPRSSPVPIIGMLALTGGLINAVQTTMYALAAHVYPTPMRATGVGAAASVGRLGAILSGYAGVWALERGGSVAFFGLMALALLVVFVALAQVRRHAPVAGTANV